MKLKLGYFYHDLLNLYGDSGNIKALDWHLREQGIETTIDYLSLEDPKDIESYDFIYMGSGIERYLVLALKDAMKYKAGFKAAIENGVYILATGNSFEIFGSEIRMPSRSYPGLGLLSFATEYKTRTVHDLILPYRDHPLVGFENHSGSTVDNEETPFLSTESRTEGVVKNHFTGTYTIGPLLVRNPYICESLVHDLILQKDPKFHFRKADYTVERKAYSASLNFMKDAKLS